ncbi:FecCD family ABC transporter permease [Tenuibacillus multivorans]|uniref:Iron complex transport system permease protein n=1 Tax=Tenuibacillus multivorans TaxID=237069 RepID=A0A1H0APZ2_9BACI|nr:iron ABC transporter permease [Tenuibacillus multivorans]GEL78218.1 iron ABC transporter permease [Tenuibacillus multivorans]SDN35026.1 iron complex transport system permease protein [Tenuibacillus multivorans]
MNNYVKLKIGKLQFLVNKKATTVILSLIFVMVALIIASLGIGQMKIWPFDVVKAIFGYGEDMHDLVVNQFRMPRILLAVLAGAGLAMSGAILQGIIRNPLASPDIIGITAGSALSTVGFLVIFSDRSNSLSVSIQWLPLASLIGAILMGIFVYLLAMNRNGIQPVKLVLIGVGLSAAVEAVTTMIMTFGPIYTAARANIWLTGSVNGTNWSEVATITPWILGLVVILFFYTTKLNMQELGDDLVTNAGARVQRDRLILLVLATALAGGSVAFAGGIGFVGLMAPHIARRLVGSTYAALLPTSALIGGVIVLVADLIARTAFAPLEIPAGVFTSLIGAPYFIYLLFKTRK